MVLSRQGDHDRGAALLEQAIATHERTKFRLGLFGRKSFLGQVMRAKGDDARAIPLLLKSLTQNREVTQQWHIANALEALASIAADHRSISAFGTPVRLDPGVS